jgi:excinuclease UvrABC ATPase subunit
MSDILSMYVYEALDFFEDIDFIHEKLLLMNEI